MKINYRDFTICFTSNFLSKFIKSNNEKELDRIKKIVTNINSLEDQIKLLSDDDFPKKTLELKQKIKSGKNLNKEFRY